MIATAITAAVLTALLFTLGVVLLLNRALGRGEGNLARFRQILDTLDEPCGDTGYTTRQILRGDNLRDS